MEPNKTCSAKDHERHICCLHNKGMFAEVERLTDNPTVTCAVCLINANSPENVCMPAALGGGFNYSEMDQHKTVVRETGTPVEEGVEK